MATKTQSYQVDSRSFDQYLKWMKGNWTKTFLVLCCLVVAFELFILYNIENDFSFWPFIIPIGLIFGAFLIGRRAWASTLNKFRNAVYELNSQTLLIKRDDMDTKEIRLSDIAVIHKSK